MAEVNIKGGLKETTINAVIIRADGTREDLGTVSYWHKNWFKRFLWKFKQFLIQTYNRS